MAIVFEKIEVKKKRLGDIVNFKRGFDLPSYERKEGLCPIISSSGISGYHYEYKLDGEGLITGRYGTLGEMYYINGKYWPHNTTLYVTDFKGNYPKYVYFLMKSLGSLKRTDKSTVPGIDRNDLHELVVPFIDPEFQQPVADALFNIEKKISLNARINRELEQMAKTLYDYWFVQFDFPISASQAAAMGRPDLEGKPYRTSGGAMVWNEELKRMVPRGWEVKELVSISKIIMGQSPSSDSYNASQIGLPLVNGAADFKNGLIEANVYTDAPTRTCKKDDLVFCIRATIGNLTHAEADYCIGRSVAAARPNSKEMHEVLYYAILSEMRSFMHKAAGSIIVGITKEDLEQMLVLIPERIALEKFHNLIFYIFTRLRQNNIESQELTRLRDFLLPLLMSGEVRISE